MAHPAEKYFTRINGPFAIVGTCRLCKHIDVVQKLRRNRSYRGWGFVEGNKQRGRMIQHIKTKHSNILKKDY